MNDNNYIVFEIMGIKKNNKENSFVFSSNAEYEISNDKFIKKIVISSDINQATFYLHDSLEYTKENIQQIEDYLYAYLGSMMISLLKNSYSYSSVSLKPTIRLSQKHFSNNLNNKIYLTSSIQLKTSIYFKSTLDGNKHLEKWIKDINVSNYKNKEDKYNILFGLLQGQNQVQKYMAMYAYLMSLVKEIYEKPREGQKHVVKYISDNCSRVGIKVHPYPTTRPGAKSTEMEDQFTHLRNQIGHPAIIQAKFNPYNMVNETTINQLASIICCAIEDI